MSGMPRDEDLPKKIQQSSQDAPGSGTGQGAIDTGQEHGDLETGPDREELADKVDAELDPPPDVKSLNRETSGNARSRPTGSRHSTRTAPRSSS